MGWCKPESLHQECLESSGASRLDAAERGDDDDDGGDDDNDGGDADDDDAVGHVIVSINVCIVNRFEDLWIHEVVLWIYKMTQTENIEKIVNHGIPVEYMNIGKYVSISVETWIWRKLSFNHGSVQITAEYMNIGKYI